MGLHSYKVTASKEDHGVYHSVGYTHRMAPAANRVTVSLVYCMIYCMPVHQKMPVRRTRPMQMLLQHMHRITSP
jgi:hypothetical protein